MCTYPIEDHLVGTPTLDHNGRAAANPTIGTRQRRICLSACWPLPAPCWKQFGGESLHWSAAAKPMIGARQRWLCLSSCSSLPEPWPVKISHLARTLTTPLHATTLHSHLLPAHTLHLVSISILTINCLSGSHTWASQNCRFGQIYPPHPLTPWQSIQKSLGCTPLFPSSKSVRVWGVYRHRTGWRLVGVPFWYGLGCIVSIYVWRETCDT